jgi:hypothetical protein
MTMLHRNSTFIYQVRTMLRILSASASAVLAISLFAASASAQSAPPQPSRRMQCTTTRTTTVCHYFLRGRLIRSDRTRNGRTIDVPASSRKSLEKFEPARGDAPEQTKGGASRKGA